MQVTQSPREFRRSPCPIANALDLVGDKWSLLVIRDLLDEPQTFGELLKSPEKIPTNILADRLKRLEAAGVVARSLYQERPARFTYRLTDKGAELGEVILAMVRWGTKHIPGTRTLERFRSSAEESRPPSPPAPRRRHTRK